MPALFLFRLAVTLLGLAGILGGCETSPPRPTVIAVSGPVPLDYPRPPVRKRMAKRHAKPHSCEPADETGLTEAQKAALFHQFDEALNEEAGSAAPTPAPHRFASLRACRAPSP